MLGQRIKEIRINKNISQTELSLKTGLKQCQISKIENGSRKVTAEDLSKIAQALKVNISKLLNSA